MRAAIHGRSCERMPGVFVSLVPCCDGTTRVTAIDLKTGRESAEVMECCVPKDSSAELADTIMALERRLDWVRQAKRAMQ